MRIAIEGAGVRNVMRGEEILIIGASAPGLKDELFAVSGTHSEGILVADG